MTKTLLPALVAVVLAAPAAALAQDHDHAAMTAQPTAPPVADPHAGHDMPGMDHGAMAHGDMAGMVHGDGPPMTSALGPFAMTRDASGTAWQPDSAPMWAIMGRSGGWSTMVHGFAVAFHDDQGGPRGDEGTYVASMLMGMAQRPAAGGTLTLKAMGSLDPLMGKRGYPLLLASGETADGVSELVDRQHPHDLFMELSATWSRPLAPGLSGFVYLGLPGEPALGPATFMHRFPGIANPEAPISHHWLDSTHITYGVATAGLAWRTVKLEASSFTGREPDEQRWNIERPRFDSWAARATWNPTANLSMQVSAGRLESPEQLHPEEDVKRTTASITYDKPFGADRRWQTTFAWGRNDAVGGHHPGEPTDAFLLEAAAQLGRNTLFGRAERVDKDELFGEDHANPLAGRAFTVGKLSLGGYHSIPFGPAALDLGGLVSRYDLPGAIKGEYGSSPTSVMAFVRARITG